MGPPDGVVGGGHGGLSGFEVDGRGDTTQDDNTNRDGRGIGQGHGLNLIYRAHLVGLLPWGIGLRALDLIASVLTETAHQIVGRGCL